VWIVDSLYATYPDGRYFKVKGVRVHYLTKGDQFNFTSGTIITKRSPIIQPKKMGYTDSSDITSPYEITKLLAALIDQTASFNIGTTAKQEDFPNDTPTFTFTFTRDYRTRGYFGDGSYTAENVLVEISS